MVWLRDLALRHRRWGAGLALLTVVLAASGCRTLSFYSQAIQGQYQIVAAQESIEKLLAARSTPEDLKSRLRLVQEARAFAEAHLDLPVNGHYRKYADLGRPYVVWNVEAAPAYSMEPRSWWYPFVGRLEYRGYFKEKMARDYAQALKRKGYDTHVSGASAYSTLGWFKDPVLNTFLYQQDWDVVETLFHELGHQQVFASSDKDFNEAFATLVGREGVRRWLEFKGDPSAYERYAARARREDEFAGLVLRTRHRLERLYGDERAEDGRLRANRHKHPLTPAELECAKQRVFQEMRDEYAAAKARWNGIHEYDGWFSRPMNNAKLNSVAAYHELVPGFQKLLDLNKGDLPDFYAAAKRLSRMKKEERHQWLKALAEDGEEAESRQNQPTGLYSLPPPE